MIVKFKDIINNPTLKENEEVKLKIKIQYGELTVSRALIKSINNDEIEFEPLIIEKEINKYERINIIR